MAQGEATKPLAVRAPTLLNVGTLDHFGWTGRFADIEAVSFFAITSAANMNMPIATILDRLRQDRGYIADFTESFGAEEITKKKVGLALTRYVGSIVSSPSTFDRWVEGDAVAIEPAAKRGFAVFNGKGRCAECHAGWTFTDGSFHDIGLANESDLGRGVLFPTSLKLQHAYKTPTLRNAAVRAPYMHDGSLATLEAVIDHYDKGGVARPSRAEDLKPLHLSSGEKADLLAFLQTLTSSSDFKVGADAAD